MLLLGKPKSLEIIILLHRLSLVLVGRDLENCTRTPLMIFAQSLHSNLTLF